MPQAAALPRYSQPGWIRREYEVHVHFDVLVHLQDAEHLAQPAGVECRS
jgi:hypothetical protein